MGAVEREVHVPVVAGSVQPSAVADDCGNAVRRVNQTLQTGVLAVLSKFVPELRKLPGDQAYSKTLDDVALLTRCFRVFREKRDLFSAMLVDEFNNPATDDSTILSCGRSLDQVVAMIVRTAAKRHFRRRYAPAHPKAEAAHKRLHARFGALWGRKVVHCAVQSPPRNRGDELYDALKANLRHEWQTPLVPLYADMSVNMALSLGEKVLELRDKETLRRVIDDPEEAAKLFETAKSAAAPAPKKEDRARLSAILGTDGMLKPAAFDDVLKRPDVKRLVKGGEAALTIGGPLKRVGAMPAKLLVAELGLCLDQLTVLLLVGHDVIGEESFDRFFGPKADAAVVMRMTQKARAAGIDQVSGLEDCAAFIRELFKRPSAGG